MFGTRLKELREAKGWSQKKLAEVSGLSQNGISHWENNERVPSWDAVLNLCQALGVECTAFSGERNATSPQGGPATAAEPAPKPKRGRPKKTK